jgi:hypothetical protein
MAPSSSNVSTLSQAAPTVATGDIVLVGMIGQYGTAFTLAAPTKASGTATIGSFSLPVSNYPAVAHNPGSGVACASVTSGGTLTITETLGSGSTFLGLFVCNVSGATCTTDGTDASNNGSANSPWPAYTTGVATANAKDVVVSTISVTSPSGSVGFSAGGSPGTYTIPTNGAENNGSCCGPGALSYQISTATNTFTPNFSGAGTLVSYAGVVVAFKASGVTPSISCYKGLLGVGC